jgi:hypothetical protein
MAGLRGALLVLLALVAGVAAYTAGAPSTFLTGSIGAGLRMPAVTSSMGLSKASYT